MTIESESAGPILVVEDEAHTRDILALYLGEAGFETVTAETGVTAMLVGPV